MRRARLSPAAPLPMMRTSKNLVSDCVMALMARV
jgi:hypothetical protein